ncbi:MULTISPECIES: type VII secretion system-associated protein [unclassified Streptomyces]|uniref:type VII secretion system-associated protein n=1 Tax=unclassified Streptomyces TaxID=2593676 RepID=UPI0037A917D8
MPASDGLPGDARDLYAAFLPATEEAAPARFPRASVPPSARPPAAVAAGEPGFPAPPADILAAARSTPEHWLSVTDRHWLGESDDESPPPWAVLGRWRSDERGEIVAWEANPDYRPSPAALGWPPPVSDADAAVHLAATGYGPDADVADALAQAGTVAVCVGQDGRPASTRTPGGTHAVPVFPESPRARADRLPAHVMMTLPELLHRLPEGRNVLFLSSSAPAALLVRADELRARWEETAGEQAPGTPARTGGRPSTESGTPSERGHDE